MYNYLQLLTNLPIFSSLGLVKLEFILALVIFLLTAASFLLSPYRTTNKDQFISSWVLTAVVGGSLGFASSSLKPLLAAFYIFGMGKIIPSPFEWASTTKKLRSHFVFLMIALGLSLFPIEVESFGVFVFMVLIFLFRFFPILFSERIQDYWTIILNLGILICLVLHKQEKFYGLILFSVLWMSRFLHIIYFKLQTQAAFKGGDCGWSELVNSAPKFYLYSILLTVLFQVLATFTSLLLIKNSLATALCFFASILSIIKLKKKSPGFQHSYYHKVRIQEH